MVPPWQKMFQNCVESILQHSQGTAAKCSTPVVPNNKFQFCVVSPFLVW